MSKGKNKKGEGEASQDRINEPAIEEFVAEASDDSVDEVISVVGDLRTEDFLEKNGQSLAEEESPMEDPIPIDEKGLAAEKLDKAQKDLLYLKAEFDNYRKQVIKERSELRKFGHEGFVVQLLGVVDVFEKALGSEINNENFESFVEGVKMTSKQLNDVLEKFGVQKIESEGKPFDPQVHEALSSEETEKYEAGHVCRVFSDAYKLHGKVIRPAQVVVAK